MGATPPILPYAGAAAAAAGLTPEQLGQIAQAKRSGAKVRRAIGVGKTDGWTIAIFGALTLGLSLGSVTGILLGAAMVVLGVLQLRSVRDLEQLRPEATRRMAIHQLVLGLLILLYAVSMGWGAWTNPHPFSELSSTDPQVMEMLGPYEQMAKDLYAAFYALVAVAGGAGCGLTALYYRTRERHVVAYRNETPAWILELQKAGMRL